MEALPRKTTSDSIESLIDRGLARRANQDELDVHDLVENSHLGLWMNKYNETCINTLLNGTGNSQ